MDNKVGRANLKKYRTYDPSSSYPSTSTQPPTNHAVASPAPRIANPLIATSKPPAQSGTPRHTLLKRRPITNSGRSTPSTTSRTNPPVHPPTTPALLLPTLGSRSRGDQTPAEQPNQYSGIAPLLAVIKDQQTAILTQNATFDLSLRDLVAELGKLSERMKQKEEDTKESEAREKAKEEKEKGQLKVLTLLAQGVDDVRKRVIGIETVVGVSKGQDGDQMTMLDRLQNIEMNVEEWSERARDPDAAITGDRHGSIQPPTPSSLSPTCPSVVRHEIAVSPINLSSTSQAASTRTPEPLSTPKLTKVDASTQVDTSDEPSTQPTDTQEVTDSGSICLPCSNKLRYLYTQLHSLDNIDMSDSTASAPSHSKGKEVDNTSPQRSDQVVDDNPFLAQPDVSLPSAASIAPATPATTEPTCERNETPVANSEPPPEELAIGSFSPAEWRKTPAPSASAVEESASLIPSTITLGQNKSYTLPAFPEGTIAALRKEALVDPYPHPLESTGLGDGNGLVLAMASVVGANSVEAAERMPSPVSQCEEDHMDDDEGNIEEPSTPKVSDTQHSDSKRSSSPTPQPNEQANTRPVEKSTESTPIPPTQIMAPVLRRGRSMSTQSSLTSLSSDSSTLSSNIEGDSSTPRPPSAKQVQPSTPVATVHAHPPIHPASQSSNTTEDEDNVITLVMDAQPTSPAVPPPQPQTTFSPLLSASPLVLVSPEPGRTRLSDSPGNDDDDDPGVKESLIKLKEWYRQQRMKQENNITPAKSTDDSNPTTQNEDARIPQTDNPTLDPGSPLFSSPHVSPRRPEGGQSTNPTDDPTCNVSQHDNSNLPLTGSPLFTSPGVTPRKPDGDAIPGQPEPPPPYLKKLVEIVMDDDTDIVPLKRNRAPSTTAGSAGTVVSFEKGKDKKPTPPASQTQPPKSKVGSTTLNNKRQTSKAKTRIKKRKVSQDPTAIEAESEVEDEEDQPPLKRVKLRLGKAPTPSGGGGSGGGSNTATVTTTNNKVAPTMSARKPKSVTVVSPVKTPMKRKARGQQPRPASIVWPKIDKPVFDQFIECDICERWYHVGCVGIRPDDIRLSASEIYRCPPCESGVSKEGKFLIPNHSLTPVQTNQGNREDDACARPKCLCPRRKRQSIKKETTFTVESFVGMVKKAVGGRGIKLVYLVKWQGYDFEDATWEEEAAMGLPNPGFFVEEFEEQAKKEGIDLSLCNAQASLLECAVEAGWKPNGIFVKKET